MAIPIDTIKISITDNNYEDNDDDIFRSSNYVKYIVLFLIMIIMNTEIFIDNVLCKIGNGMVVGNTLTNKGTFALYFLITLTYILYEWLVERDYI